MSQNVSIGRIVVLHPGENPESTPLVLPNGMKSAPAIVTQVFKHHVNLTVFICATDGGSPVRTYWSVPHKSNANGEAYWEWPEKV